MNLSDLADVGELLGGIAVIASLVYLAIQIRQNTRTVRNSTLQSNTALWVSLFCSLIEPDNVKAYGAGLSGNADIKPLQYTQFFLICRSFFVAFENQYYQYRHGSLDEMTYQGYQRAIADQCLAFPGFRMWWQQSAHVFTDAFRDHIDGMIAKQPLLEPNHYLHQWHQLAQQNAGSVQPQATSV